MFNYDKLIENEEISKKNLIDKLSYYKNFGICDSLLITPESVGMYQNEVSINKTPVSNNTLKVFD